MDLYALTHTMSPVLAQVAAEYSGPSLLGLSDMGGFFSSSPVPDS